MFIQKINKEAKIPQKAHNTDTGYDIYATHEIKRKAGLVYLGTGLKIAPKNDGMYFEIHARSSCPKYGWTLANNVGIIDADYRGELILCMYKLHDTAVLPELPWRCAQLIPRKRIDTAVEEVSSLADTVRGDGGFGSTN